jgi:hypothetical protein
MLMHTVFEHLSSCACVCAFACVRVRARARARVCVQVLKYHKHTHGVVMGGANRRAEAEKLVKGVNTI